MDLILAALLVSSPSFEACHNCAVMLSFFDGFIGLEKCEAACVVHEMGGANAIEGWTETNSV